MDNTESNNDKVTIHFGERNTKLQENKIFPNNEIKTTKYNMFTWAPKSLLMQFNRAANIYFLIVSVLTSLSFSPKQPGSMIGTFAFVLVCTMIKEAIEDYNRYKQDKQSNNRIVWKYEKGVWKQVKCWTLLPGDIIKIEKDEEFSADTLIIKSTNESGYGYIDTKNLDGETNLKEKASLELFRNIDEGDYGGVAGSIECERPNENLNNWSGNILLNDQPQSVCRLNNLILKGCVLKNTNYVCGIVIYSGKNTKIMKNSKAARQKMSNVLLTMNILLYSVFAFDIVLCAAFGALNTIFTEEHQNVYTYIFLVKNNNSYGVRFIINFLTIFVAYSSVIPISLYVALEIVKIVQGLLIYYDNEIYDYIIDKPATCRATDLIEELGQVEFIFSDKTGTLTQNSMVLKKVYINQKVYGNVKDKEIDAPFTINGDTQLEKKLRSPDEEDLEDQVAIKEFFKILSLCHGVFPEMNKDGKLIYQGASPDDIALVGGAQQIGYEFTSKEYSELTITDHIQEISNKYDIKAEMPFDSDRKRMSVIVYDKTNQVYKILSKGADTMMLGRINFHSGELEEVVRVIKVLSKEGLRVLVLASREIPDEEFNIWYNKYQEARIKDESLLPNLYEEMENMLTFAGCTAIEDKLQDGVGDTIYTLLTCNIRIWVLTGDKQDTAEEIAKSCKLINENMHLLYLVKDDRTTQEKIYKEKEEYGIEFNQEAPIDMEEITRRIRKSKGKDLSIIVDGITLEEILSDKELSFLFFRIAIAAKSVICCRVSPKQKSKVVTLAKTNGKWITLSIGDGANDVPMIMEAHIGVGIQGKEGTQAVRSADFSIGQFRFLEKLLLIYGRIGYVKISKFICYYFYKNIILVFSDIFFALSNGFSGQIFFADYLTTLYNAFFTSWPCIVVFSLERDVSLSIVKKFPMLYLAGQKNYFFNMRVFWGYIIYAVWHGFLCFYIPNYAMYEDNDSTGITFNHWYISTTGFSLLIQVVTFKLLIISDFWNGFNLFAIAFSIFFYYGSLSILCWRPISSTFQNELAGVLFNLVTYPKFWLVIILGTVLCLTIDIVLKQIVYNTRPIPTDYIKQHLKEPAFEALVFNDENQIQKFNTEEAKKAELRLKEILKESRKNYKTVHRTDIISSLDITGDVSAMNNQNDKLLLNGRGQTQDIKTKHEPSQLETHGDRTEIIFDEADEHKKMLLKKSTFSHVENQNKDESFKSEEDTPYMSRHVSLRKKKDDSSIMDKDEVDHIDISASSSSNSKNENLKKITTLNKVLDTYIHLKSNNQITDDMVYKGLNDEEEDN